MKIIKYLILFFALMIIAYFFIINYFIYLSGTQKPSDGADTMIILGAQVVSQPAIPCRTLQERLDTAISYLKTNSQTKIIVCGGQGKDESETEASVMKKYLIKYGNIDKDRIIEEDISTRTIDQFKLSKSLMPLGKTVVVTSDFHMYRSLMYARWYNIDAEGLPAETKNKDKDIALIREPLALIKTFIVDYISR